MRRWLRCGLLALAIPLAREALAADDAMKSSVVRIEVDKLVTRQTSGGNLRTKMETYVGSGFWVAGTKRIVTCAHVLEGSRQVRVSRFGASPSQKPWSSEAGQVMLCHSDRGHDVAVLEVPEVGVGLLLTTAALATSAPIRSVGHTENVPWRINDGRYTQGITARLINVPLDGDVLICDISFGPGSSGGIVVDRDNRIFGMIQGGTSGGIYGTKIVIPAATIQRALESVADGQPCHGGLITTGAAIMANPNTFSDLIRVDADRRDEFPARFWGQAAYGFVTGADRFDDPLSAFQLGVLRSSTNARSWSLRVEVARRKVDRTLESGTQQIADVAEMRRVSVTAGPRIALKEFGRVTLYSTLAVGYIRDRITHHYTFSSPLFAPQSYERSASGVVGEFALDAEVQIVLNLRLALSSEVWQGSGGTGNGLTHHAGLRFGVGRGAH